MEAVINNLAWVKRLLLMAVISPFILIWGEIFTCMLLPQNQDPERKIYAADPVIGFIYKPYAVDYQKGREYNVVYKINSLGIRDREYGAKSLGIFRVLLVGDSFSVSHGLPIEESLSRQLEKAIQDSALPDKIPLKIEVVNAAVGGYSPYNYWRAYQRWAPILEPDAIVVGLSPDDYDSSNAGLKYDIVDGRSRASFREGEKITKRRQSGSKSLRTWFRRNSQLYILLRDYVYYNDVVGRLTLWMSAKGEGRAAQLNKFMLPQPESMNEAWGQSFSYLEKLNEQTAADGVTLILVSLPSKLEIVSEEYQRALSASGLRQEEIDVNMLLNRVAAFCSAWNIPLLDPRPALRERHVEVPCYFVYDGHWNAEGVLVGSEHLARQWRERGLPPWGKLYERGSAFK